MKRLTSSQVRETFLEFFIKHGHQQINGTSLIPVNDPTLLYINSGMAPLKRYFTGEEEPPASDLCDYQPCIRTTDIDDVGDRHHLTFFEMLGSWSIGNYFKQRAIELATELLTQRFGFSLGRLYATVYSGDLARNIPPDEESLRIWESVGLPRDHIVELGQDNFWGPAGDTGPCGPCTEVFYDTGDDYGPDYRPGGEFDTVSRYIEIWNAGVFMQYDKQADGTLRPLPFTSVDTGSGLERMTMVLNDCESVYETDLFVPIMHALDTSLAGTAMPVNARRILCDHARATAMILAEGVRPSNEGRGYVPRRLIRKMVALLQRSGVDEFPFASVIDPVVETLGDAYPRLRHERSNILSALQDEVSDFNRVVGRGLRRLDALHEKPPFTVSGKEAFSLFATYGLPIDLVRDFAVERGGTVDEAGFQEEFRRHQELSRRRLSQGETLDGPWLPASVDLEALVGRTMPATKFYGYDEMAGDGTVEALIEDGVATDTLSTGDRAEVVLDQSCFYAEGGGQVGDTGLIETSRGRFRVESTIKTREGVYLHRGAVEAGTLSVGDTARLSVDQELRRKTRANHSATHLLNAVLREKLGSHVRQAGSLVEPERLRFDFDHGAALTRAEVVDIEATVNRHILADLAVTTSVMTRDEARAMGAIGIFEDVYGSQVRVVSIGNVSREICGGTHVRSTAEIGLFRIVSEGSISAGVRRLVAVTRDQAVDYTLRRDSVLAEVASRLKTSPDDLLDHIDRLIKETRTRKRDAEQSPEQVFQSPLETLGDGTRWTFATIQSEDQAAIRNLAFRLSDENDAIVCVIGTSEETARLVVVVPTGLTGAYSAADILKRLWGAGGGNARVAQGGGARPADLSQLHSSLADVLLSYREQNVLRP